jgi:hypothetical protein
MTLQYLLRRKANLRKVAVDVACEDEIPLWTLLAPAAEDLKPGVRCRGTVEIEPVPEEPQACSGSVWNHTGLEISSKRRPRKTG